MVRFDSTKGVVVGRGGGRFARFAVIAAALALAGGVLVAGSPAEAKLAPIHVGSVSTIVARADALNNEANATLNYAEQAAHEAGTALVIDDAAFRVAKLAGERTLEGAHYVPFKDRLVSSSVPAQYAYPVRIAAYGVETLASGAPDPQKGCAGSGDYYVFSRASAASPWRATLEPFVARISALPAFASHHGHGDFAGSSGLSIPVSAMGSALVRALEGRAATGAGNALVPAIDYANSNSCAHPVFWDPRLFTGARNGLAFTSRIGAVTPSDAVGFATVGGGALVALTIREQYTERPQVSGDYVQWNHGSFTPWDLLAVGHYSSVTVVVDQQVLVLDPPAAGGPAHVVGAYDGVVSVTGTPVG